MTNPKIKFKRSSVAGKTPTLLNLDLGELALNTYDGKVFLKQDTGGVGIATTVIVVNAWTENYNATVISYDGSADVDSLKSGNIFATGITTSFGGFILRNPSDTSFDSSSLTFDDSIPPPTFDSSPISAGIYADGSASFSGIVTATQGFVGNLTGNVTGNITGIASTAVNLETARDFSVSGDVATSSAVSFDGSGNVDLSVTLSNTFNANTSGIITASSFSGSLEGNADTATYATTAGIATNAQGLTGSPSITVSNITASQLDVSGITTASSFSGDGSTLSGIVTQIAAGDNISIDQGTGVVTITGLANTANVVADTINTGSLNVTGIGTVGVLSARDGVVSGTLTATNYVGDGSLMSGLVTSITAGDNISIDQSTGNVTITGLANTAHVRAETLTVSGVSTFSDDANFQNVSVGGTLSLSGAGSQFFAFNEDTVKVKFANWYSSNDRQYGMGQLWFETWFAAIDNNPSPSLRDERRIGFYLEQPNNGSSDSGGTNNLHPTNDRMHIDINGVFVRDNFEVSGDANVTGISTFQSDVNVGGDLTITGNTSIGILSATDAVYTGVVTATSFSGSGTNLTGLVTSIVAGDNISVSGSTGEVTITGLANTSNVQADTLTVSGVSTFTGQLNAGTISASNGTFSGNVTIGGTLTYEDVKNIDSVGIVTARSGVRITGGGVDVVGVSTFNNDIYVDQIRRLTDNSTNTKIQLNAGQMKLFAGNGTTAKISLNGTVAITTNTTVTGVLTATSFSGNGTNLTGLVTSIIAGDNISVSGSTGSVTITGLANTSNVVTDSLVVSGISTLGIVTGVTSIEATTYYGDVVGNVTGDVTGNADTATYATTAGIATYATTAGIATNAQGLTGTPDITVGFLTATTGEFSGNVTIGGNLTLGQGTVDVITSTKTSTSQDSIDTFAIATYRSVSYDIQITRGSLFHTTTIKIVHDGTDTYMTEYATMTTGSSLASFSSDINSGNVRLLATPTSATSTVFKIVRTLIKV